jgi:D-threonate/D-erythronate kinase
MRLFIAADDLTGALDASVPFSRRGIEVRVDLRSGIPAVSVTAVTTESRHLSASKAGARVRAAAEAARKSGTDIFFKKVDSLLRGNVGAEIAGALSGFATDRCFFSPALPAQGRRVKHGRLLIDKGSLSDDMKDSLNPVESESVADILAAQTRLPLLVDPADLGRDGIFVADASTDGEIETGVREALEAGYTLFSGSSGMGNALARIVAASDADLPEDDPFELAEPLLIISGSRHPVSERQTSALLEAGKASLVEIPPGGDRAEPRARIRAEIAPGRPVLLRTAFIKGISLTQAEKCAAVLAEMAGELLDSGKIASVFVAGGDTVSSILSKLAVDSLHPETEPMPGTASFPVTLGSRRIRFYSKSGAFGTETYYLDFLKKGRNR